MSTVPNPRASLLAGLRTGGVRSASQPAVPQTAAPGGSFSVPRFASFTGHYIPEDETDELADMLSHNLQMNGGHNMMHHPATASAADGMGNMFQQQQKQAFLRQLAAQQRLNGLGGNMQMDAQVQVQAQAQLQMQVMQMEIMKLQALQQAQQVQQFQTELMAQAQRQQSQQRAARRSGFAEPATAGPLNTSFDFRNSPAAPTRGSNADEYQLNGNDDMQPMTAALGGKFGSRSLQSGLNPNANVFTSRTELVEEPLKTGGLPNGRTTVISGGTPLGSSVTPSKSDSALTWRRAAPATNARSVSGSPFVKVTPPSSDDSSHWKSRPEPLRFNGGIHGTIPTVSIESADFEDGDDSDHSYSSDLAQIATINSNDIDGIESSPGTPPSAGSANSLSAREEASKRLYEGLGIGRPVQHNAVPPVTAPQRSFSQPTRQPRGPPASVDELGSRNFASRSQMKLLVGEY